MDTIRAYAVKKAKGALEPWEYQPGPLGPQEVEVRMQYCGVCHSDLEMIDNGWGMTEYPLVPGHEVIGEIVAVGAEVHSLRPGARVGVGWQAGSCNECRYCRRGKEHLCIVPEKVEQTVVKHYGGFGDRVRCQARWAVPIPAELDPALAGPLLCAGTTVWSPIRHFGVRAGMETAIVGIGGLGHIAVQFLAKLGANVTAISTKHDKEDEARGFGATDFIATKGTDELKAARGRFDFILSTVSAHLPWDEYVAALAPEGRLCIAGVPDKEISVQAFPLIEAEKSITGGRAGAPGDTTEMLAFCARQGVAPKCEQFPLAEVNAAVEHVRSGKARYRAVLAA